MRPCRPFVLVITALAPFSALVAADPVVSLDFDERLMGLAMQSGGKGFVATVRHERREFNADGESTATFPMRDAFRVAAVSRDGRMMLHDTHPVDTRIVAWDLEKREIVGRPPEDMAISKPIQFLADDGSEAITFNQQGFVRFAAPSFEVLGRRPAPPAGERWFSGFHQRGDGPLLAVFMRDVNYQNRPGSISLWDVERVREVQSIAFEHSPRAAGVSRGGEWLVANLGWTEGETRRSQVLLVSRAAPTERWDLGTSGEHAGVAFNDDDSLLARFDDEGVLTVFDTDTRRERLRTKLGSGGRMLRGAMHFTPDNRRLYVAYNEYGKADWVGRIRAFDLPE